MSFKLEVVKFNAMVDFTRHKAKENANLGLLISGD
jgi:hypothetical protein